MKHLNLQNVVNYSLKIFASVLNAFLGNVVVPKKLHVSK